MPILYIDGIGPEAHILVLSEMSSVSRTFFSTLIEDTGSIYIFRGYSTDNRCKACANATSYVLRCSSNDHSNV